MNPFPVTPLSREVQRLILKTFDVSEKEAEAISTEMVALAEGWGNPQTAMNLDWHYRVKKDLGTIRKCKWRSEAERNDFENSERQRRDTRETAERNRKRGSLYRKHRC